MHIEDLQGIQSSLAKARDKYRDLYDAGPAGCFAITNRGRIAEVNLAGAALLGVDRDKLIHRSLGRFVARASVPRWNEHLASVLRSERRQACELTFQREDGATFYARLDSIRLARLARPFREAPAGASAPAIRVAMIDISDRVRVEDALRQAHERAAWLARFPEDNPNPVLRVSADGAILYCNPAAGTLPGWTCHVGQPVAGPLGRLVSQAMAQGEQVQMEGSFGDQTYLVWAVPFPKDCYANVYARDITDRKQAAEALRQSEERFRTLVDAVTDYTYQVTVQEGRVVETAHGPGCLGVTGYSPEEFRADPELWFRMVHPEDKDRVIDQAAKLSSGLKVGPLEHQIIRKNGETRWVRNSAVPRFDPHGQYLGYEGLIQDFTEHKRLRDQFAQAQKMEAVGLLAGGVAHDFRNQLTVIKGYAEMLLRRDLVKKPARDYVQHILKAADRSATISAQLLAFSRQQILRPEVINIDSVAGDVMKSATQALGEDIRVSIAPSDELWNIRMDAGQFQQALLNLVFNARDAMPDGGQVTIETENVVLDDAFVRRHVGATPGRHVMLTVSDTGRGMSAETLLRLFEPFFTTKPVGEGTGLGLAMVHGFVSQSGGFIEVESQSGQPAGHGAPAVPGGTTFRLYFPAVEGAAEPARREARTADLAHGSGTILVVEDEEAMRQMLSETLGECGYAVLSAANGQEAMILIESERGKIDLLITDVVMPGWSGPELGKHFHAACPGAPVLLTSGRASKMLTGHGVRASEVNLLIKPFDSQTLVRTVREVLVKAART